MAYKILEVSSEGMTLTTKVLFDNGETRDVAHHSPASVEDVLAGINNNVLAMEREALAKARVVIVADEIQQNHIEKE